MRKYIICPQGIKVGDQIKSGKSASYFELCTLFKNEESNNNAIIGITKLIPIVSKIEVVMNKKRNKYIE